jgi:hypothetical protein
VDFPYFFNEELNIVYSDASLLEIGTKLKNLLGEANKWAKLTLHEDTSKDTIFIGTFDDSVEAWDYLERRNISQWEGKIKIEDLGELDKEDTSLLYLYQEEGRNVLIVLSDTEDNLRNAVDSMESGEFRKHLLTDKLGIITFKEGTSLETEES